MEVLTDSRALQLAQRMKAAEDRYNFWMTLGETKRFGKFFSLGPLLELFGVKSLLNDDRKLSSTAFENYITQDRNPFIESDELQKQANLILAQHNLANASHRVESWKNPTWREWPRMLWNKIIGRTPKDEADLRLNQRTEEVKKCVELGEGTTLIKNLRGIKTDPRSVELAQRVLDANARCESIFSPLLKLIGLDPEKKREEHIKAYLNYTDSKVENLPLLTCALAF